MAPNQESSYKKFLAGFGVLAFGALGMTAECVDPARQFAVATFPSEFTLQFE
jgi:hypothetical protein